jgi:putative peptidoglycan lipid II flippase
LYDLGQIFGALILAPTEGYRIGGITLPAFGLGVDGLVYGVILGAALHLLIQVPGLIKYHFKWSPKIDLHDPETRKVFRMMAPRLISMFCIQMIFMAQDNFASRLEVGSVTALTYGWWIMQVPQTLLGTSIATAILPTLSELFSSERFDELKEKIERAGKVMLALTIPVAIVAGVVLTPAIQAFLGLEPADTARVVDVSRIYLIGIVGHSMVELFVRSFYALQKPKYPLRSCGNLGRLHIIEPGAFTGIAGEGHCSSKHLSLFAAGRIAVGAPEPPPDVQAKVKQILLDGIDWGSFGWRSGFCRS